MSTRYTDLVLTQDDEGIFDLVLDEGAGDFETTDGLETAIVVSLFSDRRAYAEEVADPMKRRGWIGDLVSDVPNDRHGSGLWLYEQSRSRQETVVGVRNEANQALQWMIQERLLLSTTARIANVPDIRTFRLVVATETAAGGESVRAYEIARATRNGIIARLGTS